MGDEVKAIEDKLFEQYKDLLNLKGFTVRYKGKIREVQPLPINRIAEFFADLIEEQLKEQEKNDGEV